MYNVKINSCGISDCDPKWSWCTGDDGFGDNDLWAVFRGHGTIFIENEKFDIEAGFGIILPPNKRIVAYHDANDPLLVINVHFSSDIGAFSRGIISGKVRNTLFFHDLLDRVITSHYKGSEENASIWLNAAIAELEAVSKKDNIDLSSDKNSAVVYDMCDKINSSRGASPSLFEFANEYGYSEAYLGKMFHKTVGIDFSSYSVNARINKAKILLRSSTYTIGEIAETLGYCDTSFFIKQFLKSCGTTPGKYRKK